MMLFLNLNNTINLFNFGIKNGLQPTENHSETEEGKEFIYNIIFIQKFNFCGMYFFVFYAFFETLPDSYVEAAEREQIIVSNIRKTIITILFIKINKIIFLLFVVNDW